MSDSLVALLATAIHQAGRPDRDPLEWNRTLSLLARASEGNPVILEATAEGVVMNGMTCAEPAPGVAILRESLAAHDTSRVQLPGGLESRHWQEIVELFAKTAARPITAAEMLAALRVAMPLTELWGRNAGGLPVAAAPIATAALLLGGEASDAGLTTRGGKLGSFSAELSQLHTDGIDATQRLDAEKMARVLLEFHALERSGDPAQKSVIAIERRRVVPPPVLDWLIKAAMNPGVSEDVIEALASLATVDIEQILEAHGRSTSLREREGLARVFEQMHDQEAQILHGLKSGSPLQVRGAADLAARRRIASTIPVLGGLLRHTDEEVRTAAWRALEEIGTQEAINALRTKGR